MFSIRTALDPATIAEGDSIAVDGVCLTAVKITGTTFSVDASLETLKLTTLHEKKVGQKVNLERAMGVQGRLEVTS